MKRCIAGLCGAVLALSVTLTACSAPRSDTPLYDGEDVWADGADDTAAVGNGTTTSSSRAFGRTTVKLSQSKNGNSTASTKTTTQKNAKAITKKSTNATTKKSTNATTVKTADVSGMDFSFDKEDTATKPATAGTTVNVANAKPDSGSAGMADQYHITSGGTYTFSGNRSDVMILVDAPNEDVTLILNGLTIQNSSGPALYVRAASKVSLTLAEGSRNTLSDGSSYSVTDDGSTLDGAIFSKSDLTVNGNGTLTVNGNYKHGIVSKDDLVISSGTVSVNAKNVGLSGKDCVKINNGTISITAGSDGIRSDNAEDAAKGYIYLYGGKINITAGNDGVDAQTVVNIEKADLTITAGGGSDGSLSANTTESYKGIKACSDVYISGGTFAIDSLDDCIHSNGTVTIAGGTYTLSSGDDGVHADTDLSVSGSSTKLTVTKSYEGLEATNVVISGGNISVTASDDGVNAAGGNNSSSQGPARPGMGSFSSSSGSITISGGTLYVRQGGDGLDANGTLSITGGNVRVSGATSGDTAILDFDSTGTISGGTFIGTGASGGMAQNFSSSSTQGVMMVNTGTQSAGTSITLTDASGNVVLSATADRAYSCVILSCAAIKAGNRYTLKAGSYSTTITMSSTVYGSSGSAGGMRPGGF